MRIIANTVKMDVDALFRFLSHVFLYRPVLFSLFWRLLRCFCFHFSKLSIRQDLSDF